MFLEVRDVARLLAGAPGARGARCVGLEVESESAAGENYGSTFLTVRAHFHDDSQPDHSPDAKFTLPAVCKKLPPTQYLRDTFNVHVSFPKEVRINAVRSAKDRTMINFSYAILVWIPRLLACRFSAQSLPCSCEASACAVGTPATLPCSTWLPISLFAGANEAGGLTHCRGKQVRTAELAEK